MIIHAVQGQFRQIEQTALRRVAKGRDETLATRLPVGVSWNISMREGIGEFEVHTATLIHSVSSLDSSILFLHQTRRYGIDW